MCVHMYMFYKDMCMYMIIYMYVCLYIQVYLHALEHIFVSACVCLLCVGLCVYKRVLTCLCMFLYLHLTKKKRVCPNELHYSVSHSACHKESQPTTTSQTKP